MSRRTPIGSIVSLALLLMLAPSGFGRPTSMEAAGSGGPIHEGPAERIHDDHGLCIPQWERLDAEAKSAAFVAAHSEMFPRAQAAPPLYFFFPQGGTENRDLVSSHFIDHDPGASIFDWNCTPITYDGHRGVDMVIRSFSEQVIGVPVFAVADGVVTAAVDGNPDMSAEWAGQPANYVIINHGSVRETWYWHLKLGSVSVAPGNPVIAGQQIGLTASSGNSTWPHLHLESRDLPGGATFDPWSGPCNPGVSGWAHQAPMDMQPSIHDFGVSATSLSAVPWLPAEQPRTGQLALADRPHYLWMLITNLTPNSTRAFRYIRPDGSVAFQSGNGVFPNNAQFVRHYNARYTWNITDMGAIIGTWRIQMFVNGVLCLNAPIEVVAVRDPEFNRPPAPISLAFDPAAPEPEDVVFCRVNTDRVLDDPDFDVVRYLYEWRVDGVPVRTITSAGHADAIPRNTATVGQIIECTVTPSDSTASGPAATISVYLPPPGCGDADGDGIVGFADITAVLRYWGSDGPTGDADNDGEVEFADITEVLRSFGDVCE